MQLPGAKSGMSEWNVYVRD